MQSVGSVLFSILAGAVLAAGATAGIRVVMGAPRAWASSTSTSSSTASAPFVTLDTFSGPPGATVNVSGGNFAPSETVEIMFGSISGKMAATTTARGDSLFGPVAVTIPTSSTQGPLDIVAVGASSSASAYNSYYVVPLMPAITATSTSDAPGSMMYVSGTGFMDNETVAISLAGASTTAVANGSGGFSSAALTIPAVGAAGGSETLTATGLSSGATATASFYVGGFYPTVTASSYFAVPGSTVSFSGSGWEPNEPVRMAEDGNASSSTIIAADGTGAFADKGATMIPAGIAASSTTFTFVGASSTASTSVTVGIGALYPYLSLSQYFLQRGNSFTVSGSGFAPDEPVAVSTYGNGTATATADASGTFANAGPFMVPLSASSSMAISATGARSGATASTTLSIGDAVARQLSSSTLSVSLIVLNTAGGAATPSDFTVAVSGANAASSSFAGSAASTTVTVTGDTDFTVTAAAAPSSTAIVADYALSSRGACAGQIASGMSGACTLTETYTVPPPPIAVQPASPLPSGTAGTAYSAALSASTTATGAFSWRVASGTLPSGFSLDASSTASTTSISGTPSVVGTYAFTIAVANGSSTATQDYTLSIAAAAPSSSNNGGTGGGGGGGQVVYVNSAPLGGGGGGGSGGGTGYFPPSPSAVNPSAPSASSTAAGTQRGLVLGASTVNVAALRADLAILEQRLIGLELEAAGFKTNFTRNLSLGMAGPDVAALQRFLNASPLTEVAKHGPGSPGHETEYFGPATARAVARFQEIFSNKVLTPVGLTAASGFVGPATRTELNTLLIARGTASA